MANVKDFIPAFQYGHKVYPQSMIAPNTPVESGDVWFVDGDKSTGGTGKTWEDAWSTIQDAIDASSAGDVIYVAGRTHTDYTGDPVSYAETLIVPYTSSSLSIIGVSRGRTQGGLPQIKKGSGSTALLTIRAPGCLIANLGFNGSGSTGGGILLDDDYSTKSAFGTTITGCHLKNCIGPDADDAKEGGAIQWTTAGNAWQVSITDNQFYKNVADVTLMGTTNTRPQDVLIQNNIMSGNGVSTDCNIWAALGGFGSVVIDSNIFGAVPSLGSNVNLYMDLTGTLQGMLTRNMFGCITAEAETDVTFGAAGTAAYVPTTVFMAGNWGQSGATAAAADGAAGEVFRT